MSRPPGRVGEPPLNVQPIGLLDFLDIKNGGRYPQYLENVLLPTWDLRDHYEVTNARAERATAAIYPAAVAGTTVLIPAVEYWRRFVSLTVEFTPLNALDNYFGPVMMQRTGDNLVEALISDQQDVFYSLGGGGVPTGWPNYLAWQNTGAPFVRWIPTTRFWLPPGYRVMSVTASAVNTGANSTLQATYRVVEVKG